MHSFNIVSKGVPSPFASSVTAGLIVDEGYWERSCRSRWTLCDVSSYDRDWKRMYFERHTEELVEHFVPEKSDTEKVRISLLVCVFI